MFSMFCLFVFVFAWPTWVYYANKELLLLKVRDLFSPMARCIRYTFYIIMFVKWLATSRCVSREYSSSPHPYIWQPRYTYYIPIHTRDEFFSRIKLTSPRHHLYLLHIYCIIVDIKAVLIDYFREVLGWIGRETLGTASVV
jgi:hypothetical protein